MRERFCICLICIVTICCVGCSSEVKDNNEVSSYIDSEFETPQNNSGMNTQTNNNRNTKIHCNIISNNINRMGNNSAIK